MATAKHRAVDQIRRAQTLRRKQQLLEMDARIELESEMADLDEKADDYVGDDLLRLVFICCHPVLSTDARVALTLRLIGGLTTDEIARAFVTPVATIQQRIVRAKRTLSEARCRLSCLRRRSSSTASNRCSKSSTSSSTRATRRPPVTTGCGRSCATTRCAWAGSSKGCCPTSRRFTAWPRSWSCRHRVCARAPHRTARRSCSRIRTAARWDQLLIQRGLAALRRAEELRTPLGPYTLQAAIAACHARARTTEATDWKQIVALVRRAGSTQPISDRRAQSCRGCIDGLWARRRRWSIVDELVARRTARSYHLLPAVRADLLVRLGRRDEARAELVRAASLTRNEQERSLLRTRRAGLVQDLPEFASELSCILAFVKVVLYYSQLSA